MPSARNLIPAILAAAALAIPSEAQAASPGDDGYGRLSGDLTVAVGAGVSISPHAPRPLVDLRLRYLESAGLFATYEDGAAFSLSADPLRVITVGAEARPLFLARWLTGRESGSAYPDLILDSLGLELGATWSEPQGASLSPRPGLSLGLGIEVPVFPAATGIWLGLHGGLRWDDTALFGASLHGSDDREGFVNVTLSWHQIIGSHVSDLGDRPPR